MHEYSIDATSKMIYFGLASLSIIFSNLANFLVNELIGVIPGIEYSISITSIGLFGLFYLLFDNFIWKWKFLNNIGLIDTPNLNGIWEGEIQSSFHNFEERLPAKLNIHQTWSKICIEGEFNNSISSSYTASLKVNDGGATRLLYSYYNDKNPETHDMDTSNHRGYGDVNINEDILYGRYFNDPTNNKNHGILKLIKSR